jgi:hypothetical protein
MGDGVGEAAFAEEICIVAAKSTPAAEADWTGLDEMSDSDV